MQNHIILFRFVFICFHLHQIILLEMQSFSVLGCWIAHTDSFPVGRKTVA